MKFKLFVKTESNEKKLNLKKDIEFVKEQIELNNLSINNLEKYGANTRYLKEHGDRYSSILRCLENAYKNA